MTLPTLTLQLPFHLLTHRNLPLLNRSNHSNHPLEIVYNTFSQFCPDVPLIIWPPAPSSSPSSSPPPSTSKTRRKSQQKAWKKISQSNAWILRLASSASHVSQNNKDTSMGVLPHWRDDDATLTADEKACLKGTKPWTCALLLQRFNIPLHPSSSSFHAFAAETQRLCDALRLLDTWTGEVPRVSGDAKWFSVLATERCWMGVSGVLSPVFSGGNGSRRGGNQGWELEVLRKVLVLITAFERQITMLGTPTAQREFWSLSRFWEYRQVRALGREIRKCGEERGDVFSQEGGSMWDVILCADDTQLGKLIEQMIRFEDRGRRLGASFSAEKKERTSPAYYVSNVTFPSYRSTLRSKEIIAYTSLVASLLHLAYTIPLNTLISRVQSFHEQTFTPLNGFKGFLADVLDAPHGTTAFWMDFLRPYYTHGYAAATSAPGDPLALLPLRNDPFAPLQAHIRTMLAKEREYMPIFIEQYARVGGFAPASGAKVRGLLLAGERARECRDKGEEKDK